MNWDAEMWGNKYLWDKYITQNKHLSYISTKSLKLYEKFHPCLTPFKKNRTY